MERMMSVVLLVRGAIGDGVPGKPWDRTRIGSRPQRESHSCQSLPRERALSARLSISIHSAMTCLEIIARNVLLGLR